MKYKLLTQKFFDRPVLDVASDLLGKFLVRKVGKIERAFMITEVEAYDGIKDLASHASKGRTNRTEAMFGEAGNFYIYLVYGMHWMLNVVTGPKSYPAAILIRGLEGISGPGKATKALSIDKMLNSKKAEKGSGLWFEDRGISVDNRQIKRMPRIGVDYAGPVWSKKKYRFILVNKG